MTPRRQTRDINQRVPGFARHAFSGGVPQKISIPPAPASLNALRFRRENG
jgi:hypothetical protein